MSYYVTRKFLEAIFGDSLIFGSPIVGRGGFRRGVAYTVNVPGFNARKISQTFWRLRRAKMLDFMEDEEGNIRATLTEEGKNKVLTYNLDKLVIKKPKNWDGRWHIVIFDIPEKKKQARNALTEEMKQLGLLPFQKSVWIYPYDFKNEIDFVAGIFGVERYIHYIVTKNITNYDLLCVRFGLRPR